MLRNNEQLIRFHNLAEDCLLISWPPKIELVTAQEVDQLATSLRGINGIVETVPAYASLAVYYDPSVLNEAQLQPIVVKRRENLSTNTSEKVVWEIPLCYDLTFGLDQATVCATAGINHTEFIKMHSTITFTVFMRGFQPGFLYLGNLPEQLRAPRLSQPRTAVPAGSVAIADNQIGIYPLQSPGGWNIIGRTPAKLFDVSSDVLSPVNQGDKVRFKPISIEEYHQLKKLDNAPSQV
ncbi:MAG: 5-oxoprolinase subunit PxpB [Bacteroidota bacterium]